MGTHGPWLDPDALARLARICARWAREGHRDSSSAGWTRRNPCRRADDRACHAHRSGGDVAGSDVDCHENTLIRRTRCLGRVVLGGLGDRESHPFAEHALSPAADRSANGERFAWYATIGVIVFAMLLRVIVGARLPLV